VIKALQPENRNKILSLIIDGMDQKHSRVPHLGSQGSFQKALHQGITGVLVHGVGVTLYRTLETVPKGPDLTIFCIMAEVEKFVSKHGHFPEEIYVQADGGSENANKYVLASLEYIISQRWAKKILFSRLPAGHTHEDIDACFGVIWKWFRSNPCETLDAYKANISKAFENRRIHATVFDVLVVPDYQSFFKDFIDKKLSRYAKEGNTQHQWCFSAVPKSPYFPLGCKTQYRAFCSNKVIEFHVKDRLNCISTIGSLTGLEPMKTLVHWYPLATASRPVDGFYILNQLPNLRMELSPHGIPLKVYPRSVNAGVKDGITETLTEIRNKYPINSDILRTWNDWYERTAAHLDSRNQQTAVDGLQYATKLFLNGYRNSYRVPLAAYMVDSDMEPICQPIWLQNLVDTEAAEHDPLTSRILNEVEIESVTTQSVVSSIVPFVQEPRRLLGEAEEVVNRKDLFIMSSHTHYSPLGQVGKLTLKDLQALLHKRINLTGDPTPTTGANIKFKTVSYPTIC